MNQVLHILTIAARCSCERSVHRPFTVCKSGSIVCPDDKQDVSEAAEAIESVWFTLVSA